MMLKKVLRVLINYLDLGVTKIGHSLRFASLPYNPQTPQNKYECFNFKELKNLKLLIK